MEAVKGIGLYGPGMHGFILDEAELGTRIAIALDEESIEGAAGMYWWLAIGYPELEAMEAEERALHVLASLGGDPVPPSDLGW